MPAYLRFDKTNLIGRDATDEGGGHFYTKKYVEALRFASETEAMQYARAVPWIRKLLDDGHVVVEHRVT